MAPFTGAHFRRQHMDADTEVMAINQFRFVDANLYQDALSRIVPFVETPLKLVNVLASMADHRMIRVHHHYGAPATGSMRTSRWPTRFVVHNVEGPVRTVYVWTESLSRRR